MIYELSNAAEDPHAGAASAVVPGLGAAVKGGDWGEFRGAAPSPLVRSPVGAASLPEGSTFGDHEKK